MHDESARPTDATNPGAAYLLSRGIPADPLPLGIEYVPAADLFVPDKYRDGGGPRRESVRPAWMPADGRRRAPVRVAQARPRDRLRG